MSKKRANKKSKSLFHILAKLHIKLASFLLIFYLILGMIVDPRFLVYDFRQKYSAIAAGSNISVSLRVMGQPEKPIITATSNWINGVSFIQLNWNQTEDTESYDVYRDSLPLVSGLAVNSYRDTNIQKNTFYYYKVLAKGPLGETFSDEIYIFSGDHEIYIQPACQITTVNGVALNNTPKISNRTPIFSGTTTIKNAVITLELNSAKTITGTTYANANGYWSWNSPEKLDLGVHHIHIISTDPENSLVSAQDLKSFEIVEVKETEDHDHEKETSSRKAHPNEVTPPISITTLPPAENLPIENIENIPVTFEKSTFKLLVSVNNANKSINTNDYLIINTQIVVADQSLENENLELHYIITDEKNNPVLDFSENSILPKGKTIQKKIHISNLFSTGKYKVQIRTHDGEHLITGEDFFQVKEYNLLSIGGTNITLSQIMQGLSWIILILVVVILFFLFMLALEKYLSSKAKIQITEYFLAKKGYFGKGKGVQR
jgi:hypothetical protein